MDFWRTLATTVIQHINIKKAFSHAIELIFKITCELDILISIL